jgi:plastocyanin
MSRRVGILLTTALAAVAVGTVAVAPSGTLARATKPKVVKVCGYYFTPVTVKVRKGGKVKWKWASCGTPNNHDVALTKGPKGVRKSKFRSQTAPAPSSFTFTKRFKKAGRYNFVCTLHRTEMQMTVRVRR